MEELIILVKQTTMACELDFHAEQCQVSLETARMTYLPRKVSAVFEFNPAEKKNERKPEKSRKAK